MYKTYTPKYLYTNIQITCIKHILQNTYIQKAYTPKYLYNK